MDQKIIVTLLFVGILMQSVVNLSFGPVIVSSIIGAVGLIIVKTVFPEKGPEIRVFLLMFSTSVFAAGFAQCYSLLFFDRLQSTPDASNFLWIINQGQSLKQLAERGVNSPLALVIWQHVYTIVGRLGFESAAYIGVAVNGCVMGLSGCIILQIAREIFGRDNRRLRLVGSLVASNGLFILFGAVLISDAWLTLVSTLFLWSIVRLLHRQTIRAFFVSIVLTAICGWALNHLRFEQVLLLPLYWLLAFGLWWLARRDGVSLVTGVTVLFTIFVMGGGVIAKYTDDAVELRNAEKEKYGFFSAESNSEDSLGRGIASAPLPIRHVLGSTSHMIFPMPLWGYFNTGSRDYHWIKGYNGIYQLLVMPLLLYGASTVLRMFKIDRKRALPAMFLLLYFLLNWQSVIATTLETRHVGQFYGPILILAGFSRSRNPRTREEVQIISQRWFLFVVFAHCAWVLLKSII